MVPWKKKWKERSFFFFFFFEVLSNGEILIVQTSRTMELVATLSSWTSSFNLHSCFLSFGVTTCSDHRLETFCLTPYMSEMEAFFFFFFSIFPSCCCAAKKKKKRSQNGNPVGQVLFPLSPCKGRMAVAELATSRTRSISPLFPLFFFTAAATKVVVCFVFVKLCILWRLYCCKKCWKKKRKNKTSQIPWSGVVHTTWVVKWDRRGKPSE